MLPGTAVLPEAGQRSRRRSRDGLLLQQARRRRAGCDSREAAPGASTTARDAAAAGSTAARDATEPAERQLHGLRGPREPRAALPT